MLVTEAVDARSRSSGLTPEPTPALLDLKRAAAFLGLPSARSVYLHLRSRHLPLEPVRIGNRLYLRRQDLAAFVAPPTPRGGKRRTRGVARGES